MWPGLLEKKFDMLDRLVYFMWPDYQERIKKFDTLIKTGQFNSCGLIIRKGLRNLIR